MDVGAADRHVEHDLERLVHDAVAVDEARRSVGPVRDAVDVGAHQPLGARLELGDRGIDGFDAVAVEQWVSRRSPTVSAPSCARMSPIRSRHTDVGQHDVDDVLANLAAPDELDRRQAQPLLQDLGRLVAKPPGTMPPVSGQWPVFDR